MILTGIENMIANVIAKIRAYRTTTVADSGSIRNEQITKAFYAMNEKNQMPTTVLAIIAGAGAKFRTSTIYSFFTKLYALYINTMLLSSELCVNGGFDSDTVWAKTGVGGNLPTISGGTGNFTGANTEYLGQSVPLVTGATYQVIFTITAIQAGGTVKLRVGFDGLSSNVRTTAGTFTENVVCNTGNGAQVYFEGNSGYTSSIDNVSIKLVIPSVTDAVQVTELNQPYLAGNIAPNERYGMVSPNGAGKYVTHPTVTFSATDQWSLTAILNSNNTTAGSNIYFAGSPTTLVGFEYSANGKIRVRNDGSVIVGGAIPITNKIIGKTTIITLTATGNGTLNFYLNGIYLESLTISTNFSFNQFLYYANFYGRYFAHIIRSGALTATQVAAEYNFFRSIYPEIATVQIGSQEWATSNLDVVCTPQGNVINEITDNANVELITGGDMEGGLVIQKVDENGSASTLTLNTTSQISGTQDARLVITTGNANRPIVRSNNFASITSVVGKYYKLSFAYKVNSGSPIIQGYFNGSGVTAINQTLAGAGTFSVIFKALGTSSLSTIYMGNAICDMQIDNYSLQLVGWSGLTEVYDAVYAATAGSATVKDTAGCLAASAWCHNNNDSANGAIYGKLYNWYAVRTLQYDIDAYNTANPTTPWGYHVPTQTELTTLQTTLGGSTVAGGKMKKEGLSYWTTPNTNADNASGFSAIGAGYRLVDGTFVATTTNLFIHSQTAYIGQCTYNAASFSVLDWAAVKMRGASIRLIKG